MAFPRLTSKPSYPLQYLQPVELDCYGYSPSGREAIARFVRDKNIKVMVFMSALPQAVCLRLLRRLGVRTVDTEDDSFAPCAATRWSSAGSNSSCDVCCGFSCMTFTWPTPVLNRNSCWTTHACPQTGWPDDEFGRYHAFLPWQPPCSPHLIGLDPDRFWIIAVSQARPEKRVDELIRIMQRIRAARPGRVSALSTWGDGPTTVECKALVAELGLQDIVVFAGCQNDVRPYYQPADLMVHAARIESFGLAVVEAMACGIPVVASAASGPCETIIDGQTVR